MQGQVSNTRGTYPLTKRPRWITRVASKLLRHVMLEFIQVDAQPEQNLKREQQVPGVDMDMLEPLE